MLFRVFAVNDSGSRMHIVDREGRVVLSLKSKFFSAHNKWYIYTGNSTHKEDKIATVKPLTGSVTAEVSHMLLSQHVTKDSSASYKALTTWST